MRFSRKACLALVYFDKEILTYTPKFCNREMAYNPYFVSHCKEILVEESDYCIIVANKLGIVRDLHS